MIKKLLATIALSLTCALPAVAASGADITRAPNRLNDMAALQNGAKLFVNYCLSCHSAQSLRYNKLTEIGLSQQEIESNLLFATDKVGDLMTIAMTPQDAENWFGTNPPDLSVIARSRSQTMGPSGVDYVYSFLRGFYRDASKVTGWDNTIFPSVGMPHVLWQPQGERTLTRTTIKKQEQDDGAASWVRTEAFFDAQGFSTIESTTLTDYKGKAVDTFKFTHADSKQAAAYDSDMADLANFLGWMAEPNQQFRKKLGVWVLLFLGLFLFVAVRLNAAFWKDVK